MGCFYSSQNRIQIQRTFTSKDIFYLTNTWNILKIHDIVKFTDEILLRTMNQNPSIRQLWTSKLLIEGNNYDFGQGESCIRTDTSWHIGLREYSLQLVSMFDRFLSSIKDENLLITQIRCVRSSHNIATLEYDSLMTMKQSITEIIRERFQLFKYDYTIEYDNAWKKFLSFVIKHLLDKSNQLQIPTKIIISPATFIDQTSHNIMHS